MSGRARGAGDCRSPAATSVLPRANTFLESSTSELQTLPQTRQLPLSTHSHFGIDVSSLRGHLSGMATVDVAIGQRDELINAAESCS